MKTSRDFDLDPEIVQIHGRIRRIHDINIDIDELLEPGVSSFELRRRARLYHRSYKALRLAAQAEERRERLEQEERKRETARVESLIWEVAKRNRLLCEESCDVEYILNRLVAFCHLINIIDEKIVRAFSRLGIYQEIYDDHYKPVKTLTNREAWVHLIEKRAAGKVGESDSAAGESHA